MLKTNSRLVKERIRKLIVEEACLENYDIDSSGMTWEQVACKIGHIAMEEKSGDYYCRNMSPEQRFEDWVRGLPSTFDLPFLYRQPRCIDVLGDILEETQEEREKFDETSAEVLLVHLIWREIDFALRKENR